MSTTTTTSTSTDAQNPSLWIQFSDAAQERIMDLRDNPHKPALLRIYIQGGGCSGFEYKIEMAKDVQDDDLRININPVITVLIDPFSAPYLQGTEIGFETNAMGSKFVFNNPQAKSTCGCGSSFSVE